MKGLKKLALASAVAAAPFAQAELVAMDDSVLADMTGQAGVTIELDAALSVGSFTYTDTSGLVTVTDASGNTFIDAAGTIPSSAGTFAMSGITLGSSTLDASGNVSGLLDDIKIDIDIDGNAGLVIHLGGTNSQEVLAGADVNTDGLNEAVDFGLQIDSVTSNTATLASNIQILGNLGPIDVVIANNGTIGVEAFFEVKGGGMDIDVLGLGVSNLTIGDDSAPIATNANSNYAALFQSQGITSAAIADTQIPGVSNMAYVNMTINTGATTYTATDGTVTNITNALQIGITDMAMDISADLTLGNDGTSDLSLGSIAIDDLNLSGTTLKIYGH